MNTMNTSQRPSSRLSVFKRVRRKHLFNEKTTKENFYFFRNLIGSIPFSPQKFFINNGSLLALEFLKLVYLSEQH